jgi:hypothetical protein
LPYAPTIAYQHDAVGAATVGSWVGAIAACIEFAGRTVG